jgi:histone H3/H4
MKMEQATSSIVADLWASVEPRMYESLCLEEAAQTLVTALHTQFDESVVIARMFVTVPFSDLPQTIQGFVRRLSESAAVESELNATTPVLSLIGTHGQQLQWNDRRKSKNHVGIPLISSSFLDAIPMISRLLKELGIPGEWVDSHDSQVIVNTIGSAAGLFFVDDAAEAKDHAGRKIIAAQDFVSAYHVKSVFGLGSAYSSGQIVVLVAFCRDAFGRAVAERFLSLAHLFMSKTAYLVEVKKVFSKPTA